MDETITLALIKGTGNGYQTVPLGKNQQAAFKNVRSKTKVRPEMSADGVITFNVKTKISGNLVEKFPHRQTLGTEKRKSKDRLSYSSKEKSEI